MIVMMFVCNDRRIMKEHTNGWLVNVLATLTIVLMSAGTLYSAGRFVAHHLGHLAL
jgi:Mn2+/Fe2+ NRAMP family transporter